MHQQQCMIHRSGAHNQILCRWSRWRSKPLPQIPQINTDFWQVPIRHITRMEFLLKLVSSLWTVYLWASVLLSVKFFVAWEEKSESFFSVNSIFLGCCSSKSYLHSKNKSATHMIEPLIDFSPCSSAYSVPLCWRFLRLVAATSRCVYQW